MESYPGGELPGAYHYRTIIRRRHRSSELQPAFPGVSLFIQREINPVYWTGATLGSYSDDLRLQGL